MGFGNAGTIQCPKIATPVMKPGGIALFFSLSHIRTGIIGIIKIGKKLPVLEVEIDNKESKCVQLNKQTNKKKLKTKEFEEILPTFCHGTRVKP